MQPLQCCHAQFRTAKLPVPIVRRYVSGNSTSTPFPYALAHSLLSGVTLMNMNEKQEFYHGFMRMTKWGTGFIIVLLSAMAIFLV